MVLTSAVSSMFGADWRSSKTLAFMEEIAAAWKQQERGLFIDGPGLSQVLKELQKNKAQDGLTKATRTDTMTDETEDPGAPNVLLWQDFVKFISPDTQPNYSFDRIRKQFTLGAPLGKRLKPILRAQLEYFSQRYHLILDRLSRHENFQNSSHFSIAGAESSLNKKAYDITLIKNVLGRDGLRFILLGLLATNVNGNYTLEDSSDHIELDLSQAQKSLGSFYCEGMFVIVEGIYSQSGGSMGNDANSISGCFHVSSIGHPPAEKRDVGLENYGHLDFMGMHSDGKSRGGGLVKVDRNLRKELSALEKTLVGHRLMILGCDVHLDKPRVMEGLDKFFGKLEESLEDNSEPDGLTEHVVVVLAGSFSSHPLSPLDGLATLSSSESYKHNFDKFAEILAKYPLVVKTCKLLLIPGPNDPWQSAHSLGRSAVDCLPQLPMPKVFVTRLERLLPRGHLILGWNPMRMNYISQELVFLRDDIMNKFKRNDIVFEHDLRVEHDTLMKEAKNEDKDVQNLVTSEVRLSTKVKQARQLVKTLLDQGTLQPFLNNLKLVNPTYQNCLRIEPLPTTICLFDLRFECFDVTYNGSKVVNMGNFLGNSNSRMMQYAVYTPCNKKYAFKTLYF